MEIGALFSVGPILARVPRVSSSLRSPVVDASDCSYSVQSVPVRVVGSPPFRVKGRVSTAYGLEAVEEVNELIAC